MLRVSLLSGFAALVLFAAPASADGLKVGGFALSNQNIGTVNNTAAGVGNVAAQKVTGVQAGGHYKKHGYPGYPGINSNIGTVNNVAAGVKNTAVQSVTGIQTGFGKGAAFNSNLGSASNLAAGVGNTAIQDVTAIQKR